MNVIALSLVAYLVLGTTLVLSSAATGWRTVFLRRQSQ
jgi:hypothetical protein